MPTTPVRESVEAKMFAGLITNVDPEDVPPGGATVQVNLQCAVTGRLECRGGLRPLQFEN